MFTNIYRYAVGCNSNEDIKRVWQVVLYIPEAINIKNRSGLVCALNFNDYSEKVISAKKMVALCQAISERLVIISSMIHGAEISFYERKGLLPNNNGRAYQDQWLTIGRTSAETLPDYNMTEKRWEEMFNTMLFTPYFGPFQNANIQKISDILFETLRQLSKPGQRIYASYESIANRIMDCVKEITPLIIKGSKSCITENPNDKSVCPLIRLLERLTISEGDLRFVPAYREHFIHSFHVFILGWAFLRDKLYLNKTIKTTDGKEVDAMVFLQSWFLTAMFHDTAYGVEKMESLAENYYHEILLGKKIAQSSKTKLLKPFSFDRGSLVVDSDIHKYLSDLKPLESLNHSLSRALATKADHGILSSFALSKTLEGIKSPADEKADAKLKTKLEACQQCIKALDITVGLDGDDKNSESLSTAICKAIAMHHAYDSHWDFTGNNYSAYQALPPAMSQMKMSNILLMLLVLCDSLSQAGRTLDPIELQKDLSNKKDEKKKEEVKKEGGEN